MKTPRGRTLYMGIDQYGETYHGLTHPRRDLMARFGTRHAERMFQDGKDGQAVHVGYIVGGRWVSLYEVRPFERVAQ